MEINGIITPFSSKGDTIAHFEIFQDGVYQRRTAKILGTVESLNSGHVATIIGEGYNYQAVNLHYVKSVRDLSNAGLRGEKFGIEGTGYVQFKSIPNIIALYNEDGFVFAKGGEITMQKKQYVLSPVQSLLELSFEELPHLFESSEHMLFDEEMTVLKYLINKQMKFMSLRFQKIVDNSFATLVKAAANDYGIQLEVPDYSYHKDYTEE